MKICFFSGNKRLVYIVVFCFLMAILLIVFSFYFVFDAADKSKSILDVASENDLENLKSYYLEYELTVYGNKTINKYNYKETYKKQDDINEYFKFEILNNEFGNVVYEITNNSVKISARDQLNYFNIENYNISKINIYSLSTFLSIYYDIKKISDANNYIYTEEYDDYIILGIKFENLDENNILNPNYKLILENKGINIKKLELFISKNNNELKRYFGYTKDDNVCFEINYVKSEIN